MRVHACLCMYNLYGPGADVQPVGRPTHSLVPLVNSFEDLNLSMLSPFSLCSLELSNAGWRKGVRLDAYMCGQT